MQKRIRSGRSADYARQRLEVLHLLRQRRVRIVRQRSILILSIERRKLRLQKEIFSLDTILFSQDAQGFAGSRLVVMLQLRGGVDSSETSADALSAYSRLLSDGL